MDPTVATVYEHQLKRARVDGGSDAQGAGVGSAQIRGGQIESHPGATASAPSTSVQEEQLKYEAHEAPMHPCSAAGMEDPTVNPEPKIQPGAYTQREEASLSIISVAWCLSEG